MADYDLTGVTVFIVMPVERDLPPKTVVSLLETLDELRARKIPYEFQFNSGGALNEARCRAADLFLKSDKTRFFTIDADMVWQPKDFLRMLALSTKMDVLCASYTTKRDPPAFYVGFPGEDKTRVIETNEFGCLEISGTGLGFTVITRHVIEKLSIHAPTIEFNEGGPVAEIFSFKNVDGKFQGEDIGFFSDIRSHGFSVFMDPSITLGHIGPKEYRANVTDYLVKA